MIKLRELIIDDAKFMLEWLNDYEVKQQFSFSLKEYSLNEAMDFISKSVSDSKNLHLAITDESNQYLGTISLKDIDQINKHAEYAIVIRRSFWSKGVATKASQMILDYAQFELSLNKIYLNVLESNLASIHLYEKVGFIKKGIFEEHLFINNKFVNLLYYEILLRSKNEL